MSRQIDRTYGKIVYEADTNEWVMEKIEPHVAIRLKKIFPKIPTYGIPPYHFASTPENDMELEWFMQRYPLEIEEKDLKRIKKGSKKFRDITRGLEVILTPDFTPKPENQVYFRPGKSPRHYQWQAAEIATQKKVSICGDMMGLGKTVTGIATASINANGGLTAIVVQPHLVTQWKNKIEEFTTLTVHVIKKGIPYNLPKADIYLFKYGIISGWTNIFAEEIFYTAIFDEIQELRRGTETNKGSAAKILCQSAQVKLGLSGTPVYNYGGEIWKIYDILQGDILGTEHEFQREWCTTMGNGKFKVNDPEALGRYLREQHLMVRRTKKEAGMEMGKVSRIVEPVSHDEKKVKSFEEIAKQLAITASTGTFVQRGQASRELDMMARQITGISKAKAVAEMARMLLESGEPVLLSGWHREVYNIWLEELKDFSPVMYTGSETQSQKEKSKQKFLSGESDLMIISNRSGAGLDGLQHRCSTLIIGELDWSPKVHEQLEQRIDRDGQKNPVMILYPVSDGGSDPVIMDLCGLKSSQADGIVDLYQSDDISYGSDESRVKQLVEYYLKK